jgi:hypothetical protein
LGKEGNDAWREGKQEVERQRRHSGDGEVHCTGRSEKQSRGGRRTEGAQRKKEEKGPRGSFGKLKRSKDLPVK